MPDLDKTRATGLRRRRMESGNQNKGEKMKDQLRDIMVIAIALGLCTFLVILGAA